MAVSPLQLPGYAAPQTIDWTPLDRLGTIIDDNQKRMTLADLGRGIADGTIDYRQAAGKLAGTGNLTGTLSLLQLAEAKNKLAREQAASKDFTTSLASLYGGAPVAAPQPSPSVNSGPTVPNDSNAMPGTVGMNLKLADATQDFIQDNPGTSLSSGVRTPLQQAALYANRANNPNPVAPPGSSLHETGNAADIAGMTPEQRAMLPQYGLAQPVANDPPHVELAQGQGQGGSPSASIGSATTAGVPFSALSPRAVQLIAAVGNPSLPTAQKEQAKLLLANELDQSKMPDAVKQYVFARSQDPSIGSFTDWTRANKAAGGTQVNVDTKGQNAFAKAGGEAIAKRFAKLSDEGDTATGDLALIGQLRDLGKVIKTGAPAAIQNTLAQYGIKVGDNVGAVEAYGSIVDKLTPTQRVPGSGATSDYEGKMFKNSLPTLMKTPEGNEIIQNTLAGLAQTKIERARIAEKALSGEIEPKEALKQLRELPGPYDNFKKFAKTGFKADPNSPDQGPSTAQQPRMAQPDIDASLSNAKAAIARNPAVRGAVIQRLRENGIDTSGL